ncbi:MAG: energy transducer TonB [Crocinitomicaceae bacterium]|nr:MAG: energy transducer TonB [Crocinitomicaceae bacterium]
MKILSTFLLCFTFTFSLFAEEEYITLTIIDPIQEYYIDGAEIHESSDNHLIGKTDIYGNISFDKSKIQEIVIIKDGYLNRIYDISKLKTTIEISIEIDPSKKLYPVETKEEIIPGTSNQIMSFVDEEAHYQNSHKDLMTYIQENLVYPQYAINHNIKGKVYLKFVVLADGKVSQVKVIRGASPCLDREAVRVISEMPNWVPGKMEGVNVASYFQLPLNFSLE